MLKKSDKCVQKYLWYFSISTYFHIWSIINNLILAPILMHNENKQEAKEKALKLPNHVGIKDQE